MRFRSRRDEADELRVELTSMTDIVFLLLIFFMVSTTFVEFHRQLRLQLPESPAADAVTPARQHVIDIGPQGTLLLDGEPVRLEELPQRLRQGGGTRAVIIRADKRLAYGQVVSVLGLVRQANIADIAVAVR
ncbi:MAG: biopolymer transporter ExbD [Candidatus Tectimicrobiota bacterium]|nr:MAG: biopolymer transporter ExbD [Candidatus Tectomicrobia bacterium]